MKFTKRGEEEVNQRVNQRIVDTDLTKTRIGNHLMYLDNKDPGISRALKKPLWWKKWAREPEFMDIIHDEVTDGMVAFDIGANIGHITLILVELVGPGGHVYAVEPSPRNFEILKKNIKLNNYSDRVTPYQIAISNRNINSKLYLSKSSNLHSLTSSFNTEESVDVTVLKADEFFKDKLLPNFIKMDIEGSEVEAIQGMMETLKKAKPPVKILLEVHPMYYSKEHSLENQLRKLIDMGFHAKYVISAGVAMPDFFVERGYTPQRVYNSGSWSRGMFKNISTQDMIAAACYPNKQLVKRRFWSVVRKPWLLFNRTIYSEKIVRGLLLEK